MHNWDSTIIDKDIYLRDMLAVNSLGTFFGVSQQVLNQVWAELTAPAGNSLIYVSMEIGADLDVFHPVKSRLEYLGITDSPDPLIDAFVKKVIRGPQKIPNYSGGLGVLAGDTLKSFAACKIPVVAISLLYKKGYFSQLVDSRLGQVAWATEWEPHNTPGLYLLKNPLYPDRALEIEIPFFDDKDHPISTYAQVWMKMEINESLDFFVPELLLDYSIPSSPEWIRKSADQLYDSSSERVRATQRRMLGAGILHLAELLGISSKTLHLNEQHGVVVILHRIADQLLNTLGQDFQTIATDQDIYNAAAQVAQNIVYTIHTPVAAGHDRFSTSIYAGLSHTFCRRLLDLLARDKDNPNVYNFTSLAMKVNRSTNSVSRLHRNVTKQQFPEHADKITAITNGVHHLTWISFAKAEVFDSFPEFHNWQSDPGVFANAGKLLTNKKFRSYLEQAWAHDTKKLMDFVNAMLVRHRQQIHETWIEPPNFLSFLDDKERNLDPAVFTIGFARRFSTYKRADLIFENIDTLAEIILARNQPVNFLFSGKAHPSDEPGKSVIKLILDSQDELYHKSKGLGRLVFIPNYDMQIAKLMVAGVHVWLNNPKRPLEASGTSGMKAAMNGIPNISIMDGWWAEGYHNGATGWKFGFEAPILPGDLREDHDALLYAEDSASFYRLFPELLDTFYNKEKRSIYIDKCIMNLALNVPIFNTHRMVAEYLQKYGISLSGPIEKNIRKFRKLYQSDAE
ncbi:MAG: alpha-glucan phosphorylase [Deltaproteobacteria bacterium RIFOXYD12_FULL_57_12]|nr:MAG: alpha-glucan phosphorylase [Deltaproteobacteria bacterium RIFOXYD12_FULL_57_12]